MRKIVFLPLIALIAAAGVLVSTALTQEEPELPTFDDLETGEWTWIEPGGNTICSNGTPYAFASRPADEPSDKLLIFLDGGGACWFGDICDLEAEPAYEPFAGPDVDTLEAASGIFDFTNEENPFRDYNMVFAPYCTADVHLGNTTTTYQSEATGNEVTINHNGYNNAMSVLNWTFSNIENPETVFVTGSSAGAIPSPFYTGIVAEAYPDARIENLGDGAGGYRNPELSQTVFEAWGTASILPEGYPDISEMTFETFYTEVASQYPEISFTQYNTAFDETQIGFLQLGGLTEFDLSELIAQNLTEISAAVENFDSFTAGGAVHTILALPEFYTYEVDGVRFVDWIAALAAGEEVETVTCEDCTEPETTEAVTE